MKKDEIREKANSGSPISFFEKSYLKSSMRAIASEANVGLANIYNYFPNKDVLLQVVVAPVIVQMYDMLISHHNPQTHDYSRLVEDASPSNDNPKSVESSRDMKIKL